MEFKLPNLRRGLGKKLMRLQGANRASRVKRSKAWIWNEKRIPDGEAADEELEKRYRKNLL